MIWNLFFACLIGGSCLSIVFIRAYKNGELPVRDNFEKCLFILSLTPIINVVIVTLVMAGIYLEKLFHFFKKKFGKIKNKIEDYKSREYID